MKKKEFKFNSKQAAVGSLYIAEKNSIHWTFKIRKNFFFNEM